MSITLNISTAGHPPNKFPISEDYRLLDELLRTAHLTGPFEVTLGEYHTGTKHTPAIKVVSRDEASVLMILKPNGNGSCHEARLVIPGSFTSRKNLLLKKMCRAAKRVSKNRTNKSKKS